MTTSNSLARNFSIQTLGKIMSMLVGLVVIAVITRSLGAHAFGEYTTALTFLQFFGVVVDFGLTLTLIVMISEHSADEERVIGNFFGLRLISGFIMFTLAPIAILFFPYSSQIKSAVALGAIAYFLMGGATMLVGIFQKHESMWRSAIAEVVNRAVLLITVIMFAWLNMGVVAMVGASIIANSVWLAMMLKLSKKFVHIKPLFELAFYKRIITRSWPIAISIVFNLLYLKGDILFLAYFREASEVGIYGAAYRVIDVLTVLPTMFMGLTLPSLVNAWSKKDSQEFKRRVVNTFDLFMIVLVPIIFGTRVTATDLTILIAGDAFAVSGNVLAVLVLALIGVFLGTLFGHLVVAINKQKQMILGYVFVAIVAIAGYLLFIPTYGMWGAVWITLVSEGLIALITFLVVYRETRILPSAIILLKSIGAGAIMFALISNISLPNVLVQISVGAIVYLLTMIAIKGIDIKHAKSLLWNY